MQMWPGYNAGRVYNVGRTAPHIRLLRNIVEIWIFAGILKGYVYINIYITLFDPANKTKQSKYRDSRQHLIPHCFSIECLRRRPWHGNMT